MIFVKVDRLPRSNDYIKIILPYFNRAKKFGIFRNFNTCYRILQWCFVSKSQNMFQLTSYSWRGWWLGTLGFHHNTHPSSAINTTACALSDFGFYLCTACFSFFCYSGYDPLRTYRMLFPVCVSVDIIASGVFHLWIFPLLEKDLCQAESA